MRKIIVYQGVPGSFSHTTALWYFGKNNEFVGVRRFEGIFEYLKLGKATHGIIPIENTLAGSVYENYNHLFEYNVHVVAEHNLKVEHHLLSVPGTSFQDIKKVFSHPKALEQCNIFFDTNPKIEEIVCFDTAGAAKLIAEKRDGSMAAIASNDAAKLYGLKILKKNIEDNHHNWTRFFIIARNGDHAENADKASLIFSLAHKPGSLYHALKIFADEKVSLTKIESRPVPNQPFEYFFYVDFEFANNHTQEVKKIVKKLETRTHFLKVLGYYKSWEKAI